MTITRADLEQLRTERSPDARANLAKTMGRDYCDRLYSTSENEIALDIFRLLAADAEVKVRRAVAESLLVSLEIPRDLALKLARDVETVSVPFLEYSYALTEDDLIGLVRSTEQLAILNAIARRESISAELSAALIGKHKSEVIRTLVLNNGACIHDEDLLAMLTQKHLARDESLLEALVERGGLSLVLAEHLFTLASNALKKQLTEKYHLSQYVAEDASREARERATLGLTAGKASPGEVESLVEQLFQKKRLTASLVLKALCQGDLRFFETAMARLANVPLNNARLLILDPGPLGFKSLYEATPMPIGFMAPVKLLLDILLEETQFGRYSRSDLRERVVGRLMNSDTVHDIDNIEYLIGLMGTPERHAATVH